MARWVFQCPLLRRFEGRVTLARVHIGDSERWTPSWNARCRYTQYDHKECQTMQGIMSNTVGRPSLRLKTLSTVASGASHLSHFISDWNPQRNGIRGLQHIGNATCFFFSSFRLLKHGIPIETLYVIFRSLSILLSKRNLAQAWHTVWSYVSLCKNFDYLIWGHVTCANPFFFRILYQAYAKNRMHYSGQTLCTMSVRGEVVHLGLVWSCDQVFSNYRVTPLCGICHHCTATGSLAILKFSWDHQLGV